MPIKLVEIDISRQFSNLYNPEGHAAVWVLVKYQGFPVQLVRFTGSPKEISAERLAAELCRQCGAEIQKRELYHHLTGNIKTSTPFISIIVCTRDRTQSLRHTLDSLAAIDYPAFEVVVVDNAPSDRGTEDLVKGYPFRYCLEARPGLDWARNRGIVESQGEIVAFIDDDAVADPLWLQGVARGFSDPDTMMVTGLTLPYELETPAQELFECSYGGFGRGFERKTFNPAQMWKYAAYWPSLFGSGCNMSLRREVFNKLGLFDVALDVGTPAGGGGDLEMFHRIVKAGVAVTYNPEALVFHKHRRDYNELRKLLFNYGKAFTAFLTKCWVTEPQGRLLLLRFVVKWYLRWFVRRGLRRLRGRETMPLRLILLEACGSLCGPAAYFKAIKEARSLAGQPHQTADRVSLEEAGSWQP